MQEKKTDLPPQSIRVDICSQVINPSVFCHSEHKRGISAFQ